MKSVWERSQAGGKHRRCFSPDSGWVKTDSWQWGSAKQDAGCRMLPGAVLVGGGDRRVRFKAGRGMGDFGSLGQRLPRTKKSHHPGKVSWSRN